MDHDYIKLVHHLPEHKNWFVVNWCLGNTCNYSCSYCPKALNDGTKKWPEIESVKNFTTKVVNHASLQNVYFEFTGGEVTLYKHFTEVCKHITSLGAKVGIISNGSRTIKWWETHKDYFDHVCLSFHSEFSDEEHFISVVKLLSNSVRTHVNIMMNLEKFDYCIDVAHKITQIDNISLSIQPLTYNFGTKLCEYNDEQKNVISRQWELFGSKIKYTKHYNFYRGAMDKVYPDGRRELTNSLGCVNDKTNNWFGWKCYAGVEQLIIDMDGFIYRGWCKVGGPIGNINDTDLVLLKDPIICNRDACYNNFDIMCTKEL